MKTINVIKILIILIIILILILVGSLTMTLDNLLLGHAHAPTNYVHASSVEIKHDFPEKLEIAVLKEDPFEAPVEKEEIAQPEVEITHVPKVQTKTPEIVLIAEETIEESAVQVEIVETIIEETPASALEVKEEEISIPTFKQELWLTIPKMGVNHTVLNAVPWTDNWNPDTGLPQHFYGSLPNQEGNISIGAHRASHGSLFYNIHTMDIGDLLYLEYEGKRYTYSVYNTLISHDSDWTATIFEGFQAITIMSCHPIGSDAQRYFVQGKLINIEG